MAQEKAFSELIQLTDADFETDKLASAWKSVEDNFLHPQIASKIGYLATFWSVLEHLILIIIKSIYRLEDINLLLLIETTFIQKIAIVTSSVSLSRHQILFDQWCEIEKEINAVRTKRNDIIHGYWSHKDTEHFLVRVTSKGKFKFETAKYETKDIQKIVVRILKLIAKIKVFHDDVEKENLVELMKVSPGSLDRT